MMFKITMMTILMPMMTVMMTVVMTVMMGVMTIMMTMMMTVMTMMTKPPAGFPPHEPSTSTLAPPHQSPPWWAT